MRNLSSQDIGAGIGCNLRNVYTSRLGPPAGQSRRVCDFYRVTGTLKNRFDEGFKDNVRFFAPDPPPRREIEEVSSTTTARSQSSSQITSRVETYSNSSVLSAPSSRSQLTSRYTTQYKQAFPTRVAYTLKAAGKDQNSNDLERKYNV